MGRAEPHGIPYFRPTAPPDFCFASRTCRRELDTDLTVENVETSTLDNAKLTAITLKDKVYPFQVKLYYKAYNDIDMIETWNENFTH